MPSVKGQGSSFKEDYWCGDKIFGLVHIVDSSVDFSSVGRLDGFLPRCQRDITSRVARKMVKMVGMLELVEMVEMVYMVSIV